ncbi:MULTISPECIES: thiamine-binding protein [Thermotoga]|jgi:uncharacterized protein YqgV (UPF0045/DUF77 family)|uniref:Thiamine-binding protein domain-containing protein n=1 Tax=Thermotoga petrophila (strain ATCC BAA-488 / DSM 13995 / JCM 10881 / RKU-1) TaxID=390874 RepID=A5IJT5_THEP1|nr:MULTISPECIES: MTH1187 family thiamine-binding protein [Thermotoga]HBF69742.1 hypothetical protein [Thermotoga sp.]ABQ46458.1 protein of unknown function DUF77 [Thermotoga petrophila RKU-1]ACB08805.1 protein of unknown function DUF77 [Thermotoga sp. RQ2]AIY87802.1 hypothetical protein CELL2_02340 [Thermotoga sp. Cell2]KAF2960010.1 hypothetical protein AS158_06100 [Thermotoga sp. 38H-to]
MPKVTVSIKVIPAVEDGRLHEVIDRAIEKISSWGMKYEVGPSNTTVEGEFEEIMDRVKELVRYLEQFAKRFVLQLDIDYKVGGITIEEKVSKYR